MSKKCPPDKILSPKNRCVSKTGAMGLKLLALSSKKSQKSQKIKDPLSIKYRKICDVGLVSKKVNPLLNDISIKTGEIHDVYCVANNNKKLAALDYSSYGKKNFLNIHPMLN